MAVWQALLLVAFILAVLGLLCATCRPTKRR
jgi:hypothetical protein